MNGTKDEGRSNFQKEEVSFQHAFPLKTKLPTSRFFMLFKITSGALLLEYTAFQTDMDVSYYQFSVPKSKYALLVLQFI